MGPFDDGQGRSPAGPTPISGRRNGYLPPADPAPLTPSGADRDRHGDRLYWRDGRSSAQCYLSSPPGGNPSQRAAAVSPVNGSLPGACKVEVGRPRRHPRWCALEVARSASCQPHPGGEHPNPDQKKPRAGQQDNGAHGQESGRVSEGLGDVTCGQRAKQHTRGVD